MVGQKTEYLAGLGGIGNPSREYMRVIEAELAEEVMENARRDYVVTTAHN
jgi:hypothetical protein